MEDVLSCTEVCVGYGQERKKDGVIFPSAVVFRIGHRVRSVEDLL